VANTPKEQLGVDLPEPESVEAPEVTVEQPEDTRPEWLPEKFKDERDFLSSYNSLEEELRQRGKSQNEMQAQLDQMNSIVESLSVQSRQQYQPQQQQNNVDQIYAAYEADPVGTMAFLANQAAQQAAQQVFSQYQQQQMPQWQQQQMMQGELMATNAERVLEARHSDWQDYGSKVGEVLEANPALLSPDVLSSVDRTTDVLEMIYKQVKYDDVAQQLEAANGNTSQMKRQAQTVSGGAGRPGEPSEQDQKIDRLINAAKNSSYAAFRNP
jgi:hypothetical protein